MSGPIARNAIRAPVAALRRAPATVAALVALTLFVIWATEQAGYPVTHWAPGGLLVLGLLAVCLLFVGRVSPPRPVLIALACLAAYTALSYLSILWAHVQADAWEGANRTLLYLLVFALFSLWPQRGATALLLLGSWTVAMIVLAGFVLLRLDSDGATTLQSALLGGRLIYPSGYANANAALWLMAFWPALLLARSRRPAWLLRGLLAGGAVLLAEVALLSQSRGSLYATPVMLLLVFALLPGRVRTFVTLVPVATAIAVAAPALLRVGDRILDGGNAHQAMQHASIVALLAAAVAAAVVALGGAAETRLALSQATAARAHRVLGVFAVLLALGVLAGGWVAVGDPVSKLRHDWDTFKNGDSEEVSSGNRLTSGLGSSRYDVYRVALDEFLAHPLVGIGSDNFQQQYLQHGRSLETPHYPHSVEFRTLAETGLIGALLAVIGLGSALVAVARSIRGSDPLGRAVAAAALGGFGYWVVHGSVDWFWEFAGLGAPAFALLGLGCALSPRGETADREEGSPESVGGAWPRLPASRRGGFVLGAGAGLLVLLAAVSLAAPWASQLEVQDAARIWSGSPRHAYGALREAADLDPLSDEPYLVAGSIALRFGTLGVADHYFALALKRSPEDSYATLERGAIASAQGRRAAAVGLLERAHRLSPRDAVTRQALAVALSGRRVSVRSLNAAILARAEQL